MKKWMMILLSMFILIIFTVKCFAAADVTAVKTGCASDVISATADAPSADDLKKMKASEPFATRLADVVDHNRISANIMWTLICGFLVMFMQAGFALSSTGFTHAKNAGHTMAMVLMIYAIGILGYWVCGFAVQMGGVGSIVSLGGATGLNSEFTIHILGKTFGLLGTKGFFLNSSSYDAVIFTVFLFQMVFMNTAATIPTGTMAERWSIKSFLVYGFFISMFVYPLYANWVWGGGWLAQLGKNFGIGHGVVDFAGSSVVHMTGGVAAFAGAKILGPRLGKYKKDGTPNPMPGHHIPMAITGVFILAFGWFGFNTGASLTGCDLRIGVIAVNTVLSSAAGAVSAMIYMWMRYDKPDISIMANGLLAGLVAITAPCAYVNSISAVMIGLIAGIIVCVSVIFIDRKLKVDDPVGAISVHGLSGAWGMLAVGLFADGTYGNGINGINTTVKGLFYGNTSQFIAQIIGILINFVFVFAIMYAFFKVLDKVIPLRVSREIEIEGLDQEEVSVKAYPEFSITPSMYNQYNQR